MSGQVKKRILWCGESSHICSGFGLYTKEILSKLYATNKYEIAELSCYRDYTVPKKEPWKIYPVAVPENDPLHKEYISNDANQYGQWKFDLALIDFKPHVVLDVRDFWNFTFQDTSNFRQFYNWIIAPTYDSSPQRIETLNMFKNADLLMFHTNWAKNDLLNNTKYKTANIGPVVNDSVDHNIFKPIGYSKAFHKNRYDIPADTFVLGTVMRNQKRKLIPELFEILSQIIKTKKNIILYMHTSYPDSLAWDIPSLLLEYDVHQNVMFTYTCKNCKKHYPSLWKGPKAICKHCKYNSSVIVSLRDPIGQNELNEIYNLFDTYIQYAICEGFGIPTLEAASAGIPIITIDYGAMGDVGSKLGASLVPVQKEFRELETNAVRCYPNNGFCKDAIISRMNMPNVELNKIGKETRKKALNNFSWDKTSKVFEEVIDKVDITQKLSWDCDMRKTDVSVKIDNNNDIRGTVYHIIDAIIMEPWLKKTTFIDDIIKSANDGYTVSNNRLLAFSKENAIKILEIYLNNKIGLEMIRTGATKFPDNLHNFLNYK